MGRCFDELDLEEEVITRDDHGVYRLTKKRCQTAPLPLVKPVKQFDDEPPPRVQRPKRTAEAKVDEKLAAIRGSLETTREYADKLKAFEKERRAKSRLFWTSRRPHTCTDDYAVRAQRALERRRIMDATTARTRALQTSDARHSLATRREETMKALTRLAHSQHAYRIQAWLGLVKLATRTATFHDKVDRGRRLGHNIQTSRAIRLVARFFKRVLKRRQRHKAAICVLHVATMLNAQNEFRTACRKLQSSVLIVQRYYRHRKYFLDAQLSLLLKIWRTAADKAAAIMETASLRGGGKRTPTSSKTRAATFSGPASRTKLRKNKQTAPAALVTGTLPIATKVTLIRDFVRRRRQDFVMKRLVWEKYDLRPVLVETIKAQNPTLSRPHIRTLVDAASKYDTIAALKRNFRIPDDLLPPPQPAYLPRLITTADIAALEDRASGSSDQHRVVVPSSARSSPVPSRR